MFNPSPPRKEWLLCIDHHPAVLVEVDADQSGLFAPRRLVIVAEERAPPVLFFVLKEVCTTTAGYSFVTCMVRAEDGVGDSRASGVAAFISIGSAQIVSAIRFAEGGPFGAKIIGPAIYTPCRVVGGSVVRVG